MNSRLTLWTMERMLNSMSDPQSLTDAWAFDSDSEVQGFDKDTLLSTIMLKGMSFEPLFTDPRFFYIMNGQWWNKWKPVFDKWFVVAEKEYEPLWDRDGFEQVHEDTYDEGTNDTATSGRKTIDNDTTGTKSSTEVMDDDTTYSKSGTGSETVDDDTTQSTTGSKSGSKEIKVSAYNSSSYQPDSSESTSESSSESVTGTDDKTTNTTMSESGSGTDDRTTTFNETTSGTDDTTEVSSGTIDNDTTNDRDFDREYHSWGNWGISQTSQRLLKSELEVRYWNLYEHMADIFIDEMTIGVY